MKNNNSGTCLIWGESYSATASDRVGGTILINSDRASGEYVIDQSAWGNLGNLEDVQKVRLTTMLVDQRLQGNVAPRVTLELIESAKNKPPLPVHERAERLIPARGAPSISGTCPRACGETAQVFCKKIGQYRRRFRYWRR